MKKLLCSLLAFTMCVSAFSCSNKKKDSKPENPENVTEDSAIEKPFIEYSENDFTEINVNLNYTDNEFPLEQYDITRDSIDFGAYIPPCKAENVRDKFRPDYLDYYLDYEGYDSHDGMLEEYEASINTPTKGEIYSWTIDGDMFYCTAIYDRFCTHIHESAIFSYNLKTKETEELFRYSDAEESLQITDIFSADGELYVIHNDRYASPYTVSVLDRDKKELHNIYVSDITAYNGYITFLQNNPNRVIINKTISRETEEAYATQTVYIEYDSETGEWSEIYSNESDASDYESVQYYGCNPDYAVSDIAVRREKPEGSRKSDIVSDYWRIPSGAAKPGIIYASEDKLIYLVNLGNSQYGTESRMLHCIDFEKMEHYILDVTALGNLFRYTDGYILAAQSMTSNSPIFCILPEYGMVFRSDAESKSIYMANSKNGSVAFSGSIDTIKESYEEHFFIYSAKDSE